MKEDEKLQIYVTYENGSMQSWGYDGQYFPTVSAMLQNALGDFPAVPKNTKSMLLVWGEGLPLGDELKNTPTKELEPTCGPALIEEVAKWLADIGVIVDGN